MSQDKFDERDRRDRSVPPEEDYYKRYSVDLNFNSRENKADKLQDEKGINPAEEYNKYFSSETPPSRNRQVNEFSSGRTRNESAFSPTGQKKSRNSTAAGTKAKKKATAPKVIISIFAVFLVLLLLITALAQPLLGKINYDEKQENAYISDSELVSSSDVKNILLLGVDARSDEDSEASRADSMMLISLDKKNNCIKMTSFLRDSWVYIPCKDKYQRLNAACTYGGYSAVVDTIEYNYHVDIDGYVVADFEMFKVMVDSIGGVEVDVTEEEAKEVTNHPGRYGDVVLEAGKHTLTGEQALAYCRIRKIDTDWKRTERQRTVIEAIINGVVSSGPITAYKMVNSVSEYIQTDLSKSEIRNIALSSVSCLSGGFEQASCPFDGTWEYSNKSGASVITLDVEENQKELQNFIYGD